MDCIRGRCCEHKTMKYGERNKYLDSYRIHQALQLEGWISLEKLQIIFQSLYRECLSGLRNGREAKGLEVVNPRYIWWEDSSYSRRENPSSAVSRICLHVVP